MSTKPIPHFGLVGHYVAHYAEKTPSAVAYSSEDVSFTYLEVQEEVKRYAAAMRALGVQHGDFVAVFGPPHAQCYLAFLACCEIGAVYAGLSPKHTVRELETVLQDIQPALVFGMYGAHDRRLGETLGEALQRCGYASTIVSRVEGSAGGAIGIAEFLARGASGTTVAPADADEGIRPGDVGAIVYTSGSTGVPKGALLSQRAMIRSGYLSWRYWHGGLPEVRTLTHHPISHVGWLIGKGVSTLIAGGELHVRERFNPSEIALMLEEKRLTLWIVHPAELMMVMETPEFRTANLASLQHVSLATLPSVELLESLRKRSDATFCGSYGMTEMCGGAVLATDYAADIATVAGTVGRPLPGVEARLVDPEGNDVPDDEPGELLIRDESVFTGYLNKPEATSAALDTDGWLHTGDVMVRDANHNHNFRFAGRLKEMFKSGGYNVYPTEVETVIAAHPAVIAAAVVDAPHPKWAQVGVAFVVPNANASVSAAELDAHCRTQLANYKVPKLFEVVEQLPRIPNGKVDRLELRARASALLAKSLSHA